MQFEKPPFKDPGPRGTPLEGRLDNFFSRGLGVGEPEPLDPCIPLDPFAQDPDRLSVNQGTVRLSLWFSPNLQPESSGWVGWSSAPLRVQLSIISAPRSSSAPVLSAREENRWLVGGTRNQI